MSSAPSARTVGELKKMDYRPSSVKDELRRNVIAALRNGTPLFPGIVGYGDTVIPEVINGLLSRHDMLFLGLRGQAKTRLLRMLPELLDEWTPILAGCEIPDDPLEPQLSSGKKIISEQGDKAAVDWVHRGNRYHEKLATPDVTIADLIGEIDLVRHAQGRYLSDETTMHFGLIPRCNRGIFAINELPDLAPKIQVGLFNVLEERDVQIRGYPIRLDLDLCMVFSANPEDYTNRGRIVTPLKDRIGTVVRTHYPHSIDEAIKITRENAWIHRDSGVGVQIPLYMHEILEEFVRLARHSPHINQTSGVSVRCSIANTENLVSSAERRGIVHGEKDVIARVDDLPFIHASCRGKIELMLAEGESAEDKLVTSLIGEAVKLVFSRYTDIDALDDICQQFKGGLTLQAGDEVPTATMLENYSHVKGLKPAAVRMAKALDMSPENPACLVSAGEFILEGLYVNNRLSKVNLPGKTFFRK